MSPSCFHDTYQFTHFDNRMPCAPSNSLQSPLRHSPPSKTPTDEAKYPFQSMCLHLLLYKHYNSFSPKPHLADSNYSQTPYLSSPISLYHNASESFLSCNSYPPNFPTLTFPKTEKPQKLRMGKTPRRLIHLFFSLLLQRKKVGTRENRQRQELNPDKNGIFTSSMMTRDWRIKKRFPFFPISLFSFRRSPFWMFYSL